MYGFKTNASRDKLIFWRTFAAHCKISSTFYNLKLLWVHWALIIPYPFLFANIPTPFWPEFFMDGLGHLLVASCPGLVIGHQPKQSTSEYRKFRHPGRGDVDFKLHLHYFKNHLKCVAYWAGGEVSSHYIEHKFCFFFSNLICFCTVHYLSVRRTCSFVWWRSKSITRMLCCFLYKKCIVVLGHQWATNAYTGAGHMIIKRLNYFSNQFHSPL